MKQRSDDDIERLQDEVLLFKIVKYKEGYCDCSQGKSPSYSLGDEEEVLVQKAPEMPVNVPTTLADASNVDAGAKVRGGGTEPGSQVGSSSKHHVSDV